MALYDEFYARMLQSGAPYSIRCPLADMEKLVRRRNYREFMRRFKAVIGVVRNQNMCLFIEDDQKYFAGLFELWFKVMERPAFQFEGGDEMLFTCNGNITNLLAVTQHRNGDECIKKLIGHPENMAKLLLLYTPRSLLEIPVTPLFDANPMLASLWYACLWNWADTYVSPVVQRNYEYFLNFADNRFEPFDSDLICGYFRCTYVDNVRDRVLKRVFNQAVRRYCAGVQIANRPNPRSIAVVSAYWNGQHAVYRAFAPYVEELARHYDLTLINMAPPGRAKPETGLFKRVLDIEASPAKINVSSLVENDFQLAYFPDVGMSQESVYLANLRLAPIQCMGTGHPVSSASVYMDYFISGAEVETPDRPEENYDERLVLLPGLSVHPIKPKYVPSRPPPSNDFIVNCPWMHMKNNHRMTLMLKRILDQASRPVVFSIYPGCAATSNSSFMATIQDFSTILPSSAFVVQPDLPYDEYMRRQELGRFALHSYPFGGGTTAVDALILGKPLVVMRGRHEYNRYPAALLKRLGLEELIADSLEQWVGICVRLINDEAYLADVARRVGEVDLDAGIFRLADASGLRRAFDHLIKYDAVLRGDRDRKPVCID
ncbi:MAG: hypothetical protein LBU23_08645 [Planctomycetota bacterium]|jgi:hypothetical protein|nr:hypothetical protein [Planctomycetota bacterium]